MRTDVIKINIREGVKGEDWVGAQDSGQRLWSGSNHGRECRGLAGLDCVPFPAPPNWEILNFRVITGGCFHPGGY